MTIKQITDVLTASFGTLRHEGKFARKLLWQCSRANVMYEIFDQFESYITRFAKIAIIGFIFKFIAENRLITWLGQNWLLALAVYVAYAMTGRIVSVVTRSSRDKGRKFLELEIANLVWQKTQSVGIGTRIGSTFQQKLRTIRRCNQYDIMEVGLWPIRAAAAVITSMTAFGALALLSWKIGLVFFLVAALVSFIGACLSKWVREQEKSLQEDEDKADEYRPASLSIDSTFLGTGRFLFMRARKLHLDLIEKTLAFTRRAMTISAFTGSVTVIITATQLWLLRESLFGDMTFAKLGMTITTVSITFGSFVTTMRILFGEVSSIHDVRELMEFLEYPDLEHGKIDQSFAFAPTQSVRATGIEFAYPYVANAPKVLQGIDIELVPGEAVVIVGANGSGKTTFGYVLANIHRPNKGFVSYGAIDVGNYTTRSVLEHCLVVPQKGDLHDVKLMESLFGTLDMSSVDFDRYQKALTISGGKSVLDKLPNGIHTQIGTRYEGGVDLSGGEEQRLRLTAFFYIALDPKIKLIVADEPSRYLDPDARHSVYQGLISLARDYNKIVVVISHDAVLELFDRVVVFEGGRIAGDYRGEAIRTHAVRYVSKRLADEVAV